VGLRYEDTEPGAPDALTGIDLHVPAGTILGLLGRNGSGKTSLMSLVASLRRPTAGEVLIASADPWEDADRMAAWRRGRPSRCSTRRTSAWTPPAGTRSTTRC